MRGRMVIIILVSIFLAALHPALLPAQALNLDYSSYLGGEGWDMGQGISLGTEGRTYIAGETASSAFPTANSFQAERDGNYDAFVTALSSDGSTLFYSTYLGGSGIERAYGINLGSAGKVFIAGYTQSLNFPTQNPYQAGSGGGCDVFVTALSSDGTSLSFSTYLGGSSDECGNEISLGTDGRTYITGYTYSPDFPTVNPYQAGYGGDPEDSFVSSLSSTGSELIYSTYLGGSDDDYGYGISVGTDGTALATGYTQSTDFPIVNPCQAVSGGASDVYVTAFSPGGSSLSFSTYLGGSDNDGGMGIIMGTDGRSLLTGFTYSSDFPTANPYQAFLAGGGRDAFVTALSPGGSSLDYSTYLGGTGGWDQGYGICLETDGAPWVTGRTACSDFPTKFPYQGMFAGGSYDAFVTKFDSAGSTISCSTYLGGGSTDIGSAISLGTDGKISITGYTNSSDFPTVNPYQADYAGGNFDAFVSRLGPVAQPTCTPSATPYMTYVDSGDYSGNGRSDIAVFREAIGLWAVRGLGKIYFVAAGDIPVSGDYNGDGYADVSVFRPSTGLWAVKDVTRLYFGCTDNLPVPADYDGDGCCDAAVFNRTNGQWSLRGITAVYFGAGGDLPVPGDYNGAGGSDIAVFRPSTGLWAVRDLTKCYYGQSGDVPLPGAYRWYGEPSGSGPFPVQMTIFRPSSGLWAMRGNTRLYYGASTDVPLVADIDADALDDPLIFRPSTGLWAARNITRVYYGACGDMPATR